MTPPLPARQPSRPDPGLNPDVAGAGSLAAALARCAAETGLDLGGLGSSWGTLLFSRCTGWPFSRDVSAIHPLGGGRYAVRHRGEEFSREPSHTAREAAALVVARMPRTWGPAVAGTGHDLRDRESR